MCLFAWNGGNIVLQSRKALWDIEGEREGCWGDIDCRRACGVVRLRQAILPAYAEAVVSLTTSLFGPVASKTHRRGKFATPEQHFVEAPLSPLTAVSSAQPQQSPLRLEEIKPHKVRYYLERRDAEFEQKMAEVLCVYREVQVLKKAVRCKKPRKPVAIVSYDEKPGIQAIATTAADLPPKPGVYPTFARDHEYKRLGTLSLLAGIDLLTGKVHGLVRDRHRSREFIEFLKLLNAAYPASTAIKLILDNHSAHISKETRSWLATQAGRFEFTFTPTHGSWLNLIEGFFSKFARSVLRHIRVASKHELKERIMSGIKDVNRHHVIHTWSYKLVEAA
jgi:transposase